MEAMNKKSLLAITFVIAVVLTTFFISLDTESEAMVLNDSEATQSNLNELVEANNEFALDLYREIDKEGENTFFSPYSVSAALSMTYEGADGETAKEMRKVLHLPENDTARTSSFARLHNLFNLNKDYELKTANALWPQENYPFLDTYLRTNKEYYGAKIEKLDYTDKESREEAREKINNWVEDKTEGKIKKLIKKSTLTSYTRLVLTNAIYYKADWLEEFDKELTNKDPFYTSPEEKTNVSMMTHDGPKKFNYTETQNLKALELPYKGNTSMVIFLPKERFGLQEIKNNLSLEKINEIEQNMSRKEINVFLPKFEFKKDYSLKENLKNMGIQKAFTEGADFSKMTGSRDLFISSVDHKSYIKVNEEGTEAAAATSVVMERTSAITKDFKANHPFLFMIKEDKTDSILFMGKLEDPSN